MSLVWPTKFANTWNFCAKQIWCLRIYEECLKILILGKLDLKLVFLKNFASHTHAFDSYLSMLGGFYAKTRLFFQNSDFSGISTDRGCFSINRNWFKKILVSLCLFRSIKADFRSIENRESGFLKTEFDLFKFTFQKLFKLFSLSLIWTRLILNFLSFSSGLFARFSSLQAGKSIIPFLLH